MLFMTFKIYHFILQFFVYYEAYCSYITLCPVVLFVYYNLMSIIPIISLFISFTSSFQNLSSKVDIIHSTLRFSAKLPCFLLSFWKSSSDLLCSLIGPLHFGKIQLAYFYLGGHTIYLKSMKT